MPPTNNTASITIEKYFEALLSSITSLQKKNQALTRSQTTAAEAENIQKVISSINSGLEHLDIQTNLKLHLKQTISTIGQLYIKRAIEFGGEKADISYLHQLKELFNHIKSYGNYPSEFIPYKNYIVFLIGRTTRACVANIQATRLIDASLEVLSLCRDILSMLVSKEDIDFNDKGNHTAICILLMLYYISPFSNTKDAKKCGSFLDMKAFTSYSSQLQKAITSRKSISEAEECILYWIEIQKWFINFGHEAITDENQLPASHKPLSLSKDFLASIDTFTSNQFVAFWKKVSDPSHDANFYYLIPGIAQSANYYLELFKSSNDILHLAETTIRCHLTRNPNMSSSLAIQLLKARLKINKSHLDILTCHKLMICLGNPIDHSEFNPKLTARYLIDTNTQLSAYQTSEDSYQSLVADLDKKKVKAKKPLDEPSATTNQPTPVMKLPASVKTVTQTLLDKGKKAYITGEAVVEHLTGVKPLKFDIATNAKMAEIKELFQSEGEITVNDGVLVFTIKDSVRISSLQIDPSLTDDKSAQPEQVELANGLYIQHLTDSVEKDAARKIFGCYSLYYNCETNEISDPTKTGLDDIKNKRIACINNIEKTIETKPFLLLTIVLAMVKFSFSPSKKLKLCLTDKISLLKKYQNKNILIHEIAKTLSLTNYEHALALYKKYNLFSILYDLSDPETDLCLYRLKYFLSQKDQCQEDRYLLLWTIILYKNFTSISHLANDIESFKLIFINAGIPRKSWPDIMQVMSRHFKQINSNIDALPPDQKDRFDILARALTDIIDASKKMVPNSAKIVNNSLFFNSNEPSSSLAAPAPTASPKNN